ncbi:MAG TPA: DMT family transporter [Candidatus Deferrimicrobiaceae bacterium]|nr:DMT family transporter [Candidatus Deferrimicrobiaceae bacterium]
MPDALLPPSLAVVVLGLLASIGWGISDFGGGLASRRAPVLGVLCLTQAAGIALALPLLVLRGEPAMTTQDLVISIAGGAGAAAGLGLLYRGLSIGRMGVVAPVAGVLTAAVPVGFGIAIQGTPPLGAIVGIGLAVVSVILVSRVPASADGAAGAAGSVRSGFVMGLGAGIGFGLFAVFASQLSEGRFLGPIIVIRTTAVVFVVAAAAASRGSLRVPRRLWPAMVGIGGVDMIATTLYLAAIEIGPLAIAAVLTALYPVVTVLLAAIVLRERITALHGLGIGLAALAIALIAGATA